jgi:hypothetical protein
MVKKPHAKQAVQNLAREFTGCLTYAAITEWSAR